MYLHLSLLRTVMGLIPAIGRLFWTSTHEPYTAACRIAAWIVETQDIPDKRDTIKDYAISQTRKFPDNSDTGLEKIVLTPE